MSGYVPCACRDCMEIAIGTARVPEPLCWQCCAAGCDPDGGHECYSPHAYGGLVDDPEDSADYNSGRIV